MTTSELAIDCSGLVLPAPAGQTVDVLRAASVAGRAERAFTLLDRAAADAAAPERTCLDAVRAALAGLHPTGRLRALAHPLASFDTQLVATDEPVDDPRDSVTRALALTRHLVGLDDVDRLTVVVPPLAFSAGPLLLPHLHVSLDGQDGPVAVVTEAGTTRLTWADGTRMTLPPGGLPPPESGPAVDAGGIGGRRIDVLNGCPEVTRAFGAFRPAARTAAPPLLDALDQGLTLLRTTWPAAADMADRFLAGVLLLQPRTEVRSHTSALLPGVVLSSAADPVQVADVLCHELAHVRIALFLEHDPLLIDDGASRHLSPWRPDPRPLIGVLLGVHAFLNVCVFYRRLRDAGVAADTAELIYDSQRQKVRTGLELLRNKATPTVLGAALLAELETEVAAL